MNTLIYLRMSHLYMTRQDLDRLDAMRKYAQDSGYAVSEVWPVYDPEESPEPPKAWYEARQDLMEGRFDALVIWHLDLDVPDALTRRDLSPHLWGTKGDDGGHREE